MTISIVDTIIKRKWLNETGFYHVDEEMCLEDRTILKVQVINFPRVSRVFMLNNSFRILSSRFIDF